MNKITLISILFVVTACTSTVKEIPLNEIPEDLKWVADQTAKNIIEFCDNDQALTEFNQRSSVKAKMQRGAGKYFLTCMAYGQLVSSKSLGELYRVNRVKGNVKRFKYKLHIESEKYDLMELHVDLNSDKFLANYTIHGRQMNGEWESVLDTFEEKVRKSLRNLN
ncbi:hypothetical protein M0D21_08645 [Aquimarina sp. D1M17]|uniref:hypothetical protein n=1 Tax=Aquimarina acroporae TaxID=2937283 RepID=UPI0020C129B5|nr:hypothetical protein [Aquimarina acroporae]MCK8521635.1 hypothetical protein [Aquimarina acroporae]